MPDLLITFLATLALVAGGWFLLVMLARLVNPRTVMGAAGWSQVSLAAVAVAAGLVTLGIVR